MLNALQRALRACGYGKETAAAASPRRRIREMYYGMNMNEKYGKQGGGCKISIREVGQRLLTVGWLREYMAHDCAKRTYAYCTAPHVPH